MSDGRIAVCVSGGMDSVWTAWKLARATTADLTLIHVYSVARWRRGDAELQAFHRASDYINTVARPAREVLLHMDCPEISWSVRRPTMVLMPVAGWCAAQGFGAGDRIYTGRNSEDDLTEALGPMHRPEEARQIDLTEYRQAMIDLIFERTRERPQITSIHPAPSRAQMVDELPRQLLNILSCCCAPKRVGSRWVPCGAGPRYRSRVDEQDRCHKCAVLAPYLDRFRPENGWRHMLKRGFHN